MFHRKPWFGTAVCISIIIVVMLAPAPREWGAWGKWLSPRYDAVKPVLQPLAHIMSMATVAFLASRRLIDLPPHRMLMISLGISMGLAAAIELMQLALPAAFSRTFDLADLGFALFGALSGCFIGVMYNRKDHEQRT